jgi:AcrR family transcriptional regulator
MNATASSFRSTATRASERPFRSGSWSGQLGRQSPQRIAAAAVEVADAQGLDAVSMSKVGAGFGVSAMALYRYVLGKAELGSS